MLSNRQLSLLNSDFWDDRNDRYFMNLYKEHHDIASLYALCASLSYETYLHWRVFTAGAERGCVEILRAPLEQDMRKNPSVRFDEVKYLTLKDLAKNTEQSAP